MGKKIGGLGDVNFNFIKTPRNKLREARASYKKSTASKKPKRKVVDVVRDLFNRSRVHISNAFSFALRHFMDAASYHLGIFDGDKVKKRKRK